MTSCKRGFTSREKLESYRLCGADFGSSSPRFFQAAYSSARSLALGPENKAEQTSPSLWIAETKNPPPLASDS